MVKVLLFIITPILWVLKAIAICVYPITKLIASGNMKIAKSFEKVEIENQLVPKKDTDGNWTFFTDKQLKVLQISDIHIGAGWITAKKDKMALNAVASMIRHEKPDLVILTGDMVYPVPIQSMTLNNIISTQMIIAMMESLGVYWTIAFGNHDTELYSLYTREKLAKMYADENLKYSIFTQGPDEIDGYSNQIIKTKNSKGIDSRAFFVLDSHSYIDGDFLGAQWKYDNIHQNQIDWYKKSVEAIDAKNKAIDSTCPMFTSFAYFHIPLREYGVAWHKFKDNGYKDTDEVKHFYGRCGEPHEKSYPGKHEDNFFETMLELGSTKGTFVGHDHLNNFSIEYKGIRLTYAMTIDYHAYIGIHKKGAHRGCTMLKIDDDANFEIMQESFYQDKYETRFEKEIVDMNYIHPSDYDKTK